MTSSAASTEPSVESSDLGNLSAPLWRYVSREVVLDDNGEIVRGGGGGEGNVPFICNFCKVKFTGSHFRVRAHLLKISGTGIRVCSKITTYQKIEVRDFLATCEQRLREKGPRKVPLPPTSSMSGSGSTYFPFEERDNRGKKRRGVSAQLTQTFKIKERKQCDVEVARFFYTSGLSFNIARNPNYRSSYTRTSHIPGYVPPEYNTLRTILLDIEKRHVERMLQPIKKTWKDSGVSLCSDGWTDDQRRPLINMMAASTNGAIMLKAINCEGVFKDKFEISRLLLESIDEIGSHNVVQVVTDNVPVCSTAGAIVESTYPYIFWTPCVVHTLNLVMKNILKEKSFLPGDTVDRELGWLMEAIVNNVWYIKNFIVNHSMRLSMYNEHCVLKLLHVAETRFASHYVMLKRFKEVKNGLQQMVISPRWDTYKEDDQAKAKAVKDMLLKDKLWEQIEFMVGFMGPIYEMIRMTDLDKPCLHLVYEWWDVMIEKVKNAIFDTKFAHIIVEHCEVARFYEVVYAILLARWTKSSSPLHCMAHTLNPRYYSSQWLEEDPNRIGPHRDAELNDERRKCLQRLYSDPQVRNKVVEEFAYFSLNMGDYSTPEVLENKYHFEPIIWWASYEASTPLLQTLALKLLNQPYSYSCCERNWSTYSFIYSLKRNKLVPKRAQDLVYIHTNLRLLAMRDPSYAKNKETMWDLVGVSHDSMNPGNVDVLELASLSLDEPAFEERIFDDAIEDEA